MMLCLCAACVTMTAMLFFTKFLSKKRKSILIAQELIATFLLFFDRLAYIYAGKSGSVAYIMVRLSNFSVFFLTSAIVLCFNFYLVDLLTNEGNLPVIPKRLVFTSLFSAVGMLLVIVSSFTGLFFYIDESNLYHRGSGFLLAYLVPVLCPLIQYSAIIRYRKHFSKFIYMAVSLYILVPILAGIIQIFTYGLSIVNMVMVLVSICLYFFSYLDINAAVEKTHKTEMQFLKDSQARRKILLKQLALSFANAMEKNSSVQEGQSERIASMARTIAERSGKDKDESDRIYFSALLCNVGSKSLSLIKEFPYLSETALYVGKPYTKDSPEYARIITVARDFVHMIDDPDIPAFFARETLIREAEYKYDPVFVRIAVKILDEGTLDGTISENENKVEKEITCGTYRETVNGGIKILQDITEITFDCEPLTQEKSGDGFSAPSIILYDSSNAKVQVTPETIDSHKYVEYGEIWFNTHIITTQARNMEVRNIEDEKSGVGKSSYKITACRFGDHVLLKMQGGGKKFEVIVALPSVSKSAYIGLTGENVRLKNITQNQSGKKICEDDIPRIAERMNYIDRIESDIPNVQIVNPLEEFTKGVPVKDKMRIYLHVQSLPDANLIWHCLYIILYHSDDKKVGGKNYRKYAMIKFDGEDDGSNEFAENNFVAEKTAGFKSWDEWEEQNKAGYECQIEFFKNGNKVSLKTLNRGIFIQNTTEIKDGGKEIYVSLSGDQVALTDIRIR